MKPKLFNYPNKMIISHTTGGATSDSFYSGPAPASTLVEVNKTIPEVSPNLWTVLTDHGYYNEVSIVINLKNAGVAVQKTVVYDFWNSDGSLHSKTTSVNFDEVVDFTATYSGLDGAVADLKIQAKDASGEFITVPGEDTTTFEYHDCYFQEATDKNDLIEYGIAGVAVENLYYCRLGFEIEPTQNFQIEGYSKIVDNEEVNIDFECASLVRKIRIPGSSKPVAYDFFSKETNI